MKLMELKDKTTLSREEAAARLHAIADELASGNDVVIERETMRFIQRRQLRLIPLLRSESCG